jgi:hypothetical protein
MGVSKMRKPNEFEQKMIATLQDDGVTLELRQLAASRLTAERILYLEAELGTIRSRIGWLVFVFVVLPLILLLGSMLLGACGLTSLMGS